MTEENELPPTHQSIDGLRAVRVVAGTKEDVGGLKVAKVMFMDRDGNAYCSPAVDFHALYVKIDQA